MDDGHLNQSTSKRQQRKKDDECSVEAPSDDQSENSKTDELKMEYIKLRKTLDKMQIEEINKNKHVA